MGAPSALAQLRMARRLHSLGSDRRLSLLLLALGEVDAQSFEGQEHLQRLRQQIAKR